MELKEYISNVLLENNYDLELAKVVEDKIMEEAKKKLNSKSGCIDDETIKCWILKYASNPKLEVVTTKVETKPQPKQMDIKKDNWEMDSLF